MRKKRKARWGRTAPVLFFMAILAGCAGRERPSVILITIDTLRADRLGCYGAPRTRTHAMDRIAAEGVLFSDCVTPVPSTSPSHATILSGLYPRSHGLRENGAPLGEDVPLLSEAMRREGYATVAFVSGFPLLGEFGFDRGFDRFDDRLVDGFVDRDGERRGTERIAEKTVDAFLVWLEREEGPFFAWLHFFDPHSVYAAPGPFRRMYYDGRERDPANRSLEGIEIPAYHGLAGVTDVNYPIALYEGEVSYTDHQLERLLDGLERRGLADRVLLLVTGDHGESMTEHGYYFGHSHFLYEPSLHVPLLIRWPGRLPEGAIRTEPVSLVDIPATLMDLLSLGAVFPTEGRSLAPLARGEGDTREEAVFLERPRIRSAGELRGVRSGPWKYLDDPERGEELYRLDVDPEERENLIDTEAEEAARLRRMLEEHMRGDSADEEYTVDEETRKTLRGLGYVD
ncbi:MAG: sulfatase [Candidatus Eisenbacteria bacterium]|nr:sulfatase [Candidatus Eisenbacteria bacterium]